MLSFGNRVDSGNHWDGYKHILYVDDSLQKANFDIVGEYASNIKAAEAILAGYWVIDYLGINATPKIIDNNFKGFITIEVANNKVTVYYHDTNS